jgi:hypothetical protein
MGRGGLRHGVAVSSARHRSDPQSRDSLQRRFAADGHAFSQVPVGEAMRRSHKILSRVGGSKWRHVTQAMPSYATTQDGPHIRPFFEEMRIVEPTARGWRH